MHNYTKIGLILLAAFARASLAQPTPTESQLYIAPKPKPTQQSQVGVMPHAADIDKEMYRVERERKLMFDPNSTATQTASSVFPNVPIPQPAGVDIHVLAKQYQQKAAVHNIDDLIIFASFTMPTASLKRLIKQANLVGASVVLRGLKNNSIKQTGLAIQALGEPMGNVVVNPNAFIKYKVKVVPTIVLASAAKINQVDQVGCALPDHYVAVSGDVSLDYALEKIMHHAPQFGTVAFSYLRQVRGSP